MIVALLTATESTIFSVNASTGDFWVAKAPMPSSSDELDSSVLNGKVYVIGTNFTPNTNSNYMYDPATNNWTEKTPMPHFQSNFALAAYQGEIYVIGGVNGLPTATIQIYNPTTDSWTNNTQLPSAEGFLRAATLNGKIYVMGGALYEFSNMSYSIYGTNEAFDPTNGSWQASAPMPVPVFRFAITAVGNKIYVMGGESNDGYSNQTQIYDTQTNTWSFGSPMPVTTSYSVAAVTTGVFAPTRIYYIAGEYGSAEPYCPTQIYDPETGNWSIGATVPTPRVSNEALATVNDTIYAIGGFNGTSKISNNEQYFPAEYTGSEPLTSPTPSIPEFSLAIFPLIACLSATFFVTIFLKQLRTKR